jgi:hypothetical protein
MNMWSKTRKMFFLVLVFFFLASTTTTVLALGDEYYDAAETDVADFLGYESPAKLFGKQSFFANLQRKLEAPTMRGMASFVPNKKIENGKRTEEEARESFGFAREAYVGGQFVSGNSPDLDVGVLVRVPRGAFAEKGELEKLTTGASSSVEWFVFGDENPGERVEHESEMSVVFAKIRTPKGGGFELPLKFRARYAKPVFQNETKGKRTEKGGEINAVAEETEKIEGDAATSNISSDADAKKEETENDEPKWSKTHSRIVFPNVVILARREEDTGRWTRVGELEMRGSWYVPIAYLNQAIGVKMISIMITLGAGAFVFKAIRQKIVEEHFGLKRSASIPSLKNRSKSKKRK